MATGKIKSLYPPGNNGSHPGAGKVSEDGTGNTYVFQTPSDVADGIVLNEGTSVTFDVINGKTAGNVKLAVVLPTCTLAASASTINSGDTVTLTWTSQNAATLIMNQHIGNLSPIEGGSINVTPSGTPGSQVVYAIIAANSAGQAKAAVPIAIGSPSGG